MQKKRQTHKVFQYVLFHIQKKMFTKVGDGWVTWGIRINLETNPSQNRGWGKLKMKHLVNINSP